MSAIRHLYAGQPVAAWGGPGQGIATIDGGQWEPYLPTPPHPEYVSGHSTFSAAAAETLRLTTGSDRFGASAVVVAGSSTIELGRAPARDLSLSWSTFSEAAAQAGLSRRLGGIHFARADAEGQAAGRSVARLAWARVVRHLGGLR